MECLEITDERDRPLMVMPIAQARRQPVRHRVVLVMLYDAEGRIYLQKRAANKRLYPGRWDLSATGHVLAGESREDAALRELREELGIAAGRLIRRAEIPATEATDFAHVTLFVVGPVGEAPQPNPDEVADGMFVDADELDALLEHFRDMLTPALIWAAERGDVFRDMPCPVYADEPKLSEQS
ncbi:NUDIX domain-containing protein [Desulfovibrio oxamicus]|uniref:NUDIX domain-containing protein n=1 Tax=Nitratidesulfovibrio oxamicus TaxID=32016 RepID=A0ABS0J2B8_9BACT|nr:NUDIX domain-containing protein [Nitratidesulfovibrio oxamicus]